MSDAIKLPIEVGQKFLSSSTEVEIVCVNGKRPNHPVIDNYGDCYTKSGEIDPSDYGHYCDLQPIPAAITEGVEFSGEAYRAEFERLVKEGRELEVGCGAEWNPIVLTHFEPALTYRLVPQHLDSAGNPLKVGDRVETQFRRFRGEIVRFDNGRAYFGNETFCDLQFCRKLTTKTRPLCAADLMRYRTALFRAAGGEKTFGSDEFDAVCARIAGRSMSYEYLQSKFEWSPSADKPWGPCEMEEEVLV